MPAHTQLFKHSSLPATHTLAPWDHLRHIICEIRTAKYPTSLAQPPHDSEKKISFHVWMRNYYNFLSTLHNPSEFLIFLLLHRSSLLLFCVDFLAAYAGAFCSKLFVMCSPCSDDYKWFLIRSPAARTFTPSDVAAGLGARVKYKLWHYTQFVQCLVKITGSGRGCGWKGS